MNILFLTNKINLNVGSYRIWVNDLSSYMSDCGVTTLVRAIDDAQPSNEFTPDVVILCKSLFKDVEKYRREYPQALLGVINPDGGVLYDTDFIIVGSLEEKDSLLQNKNVFLFPLIEKKYLKISPKSHSKSDKLVIGYHGSHIHLQRFHPYINLALEELSEECDLTLKLIIDSSKLSTWGRSPKVKTEIIDWNLETFSSEIMKCDIGITPSAHNFDPIFRRNSDKLGLYETDYIVRYKNKSNAGRSFVFIQHGIPVVSDFVPSNFHLFGNPDNGFCVSSKEGWLDAFRKLKDSEFRSFVSENAYNFFTKEYNPIEWTKRIISDIEGLRNV